MELYLRKAADGLHVVSGHTRLQAALSLSDEVKVNAPGIGEVLIAKTPDGKFVATQDARTLTLFGI